MQEMYKLWRVLHCTGVKLASTIPTPLHKSLGTNASHKEEIDASLGARPSYAEEEGLIIDLIKLLGRV